MKSLQKTATVVSLLVLFAISSVAEARIGGGRSSGSRGFRGFGTSRSFQTTPRYQQQPNYSSPQQPAPRPPGAFGSPSSSGAFTRGLMGGLAGGFIGSMLFRNFSHAGMDGGGFGGGGIGIFEILLLLGLGYMAFRFFANRRLSESGEVYRSDMSHYDKLRSVEPGPYAGPDQTMASSEEEQADQLRRYDAGFDLASFKDERIDDFMRFQAAWGQRDLSELSGIIAPEIRQEFDADISQLKAQGRINRVENIAVRGTELIEAWAERGQEYATVRFRANLTDYTVTESSGEILSGSKTQPVKFEENWTFVRNVGEAGPGNPWKLSAIEV